LFALVGLGGFKLYLNSSGLNSCSTL